MSDHLFPDEAALLEAIRRSSTPAQRSQQAAELSQRLIAASAGDDLTRLITALHELEREWPGSPELLSSLKDAPNSVVREEVAYLTTQAAPGTFAWACLNLTPGDETQTLEGIRHLSTHASRAPVAARAALRRLSEQTHNPRVYTHAQHTLNRLNTPGTDTGGRESSE